MKYVVIEKMTNGSLSTFEFEKAEEAIGFAEVIWDTMNSFARANMKKFCVLESVNPDPDADNHWEGETIFGYR